jgi:hypothetical protein
MYKKVINLLSRSFNTGRYRYYEFKVMVLYAKVLNLFLWGTGAGCERRSLTFLDHDTVRSKLGSTSRLVFKCLSSVHVLWIRKDLF